MRQILFLILFLPGFTGWGQKAPDKWYKGNTHTHSYWSDGNDFPEMILEWYKTHGYDFISLSDHNTLAQEEKWKILPAHPFGQRLFQEYLTKYGPQWVQYKTDSTGKISVKLKKFTEYQSLFQEAGKFLIMPAEEISAEYKQKPIHVGAINIKEPIPPQTGNSVTEVMQRNLDAVYAQRARTGQAMFPHLNHPNFRYAITLADMIPLKGERFFEVYNGHPEVHNYGDSISMSMEELWDKLSVHYIKQGKPLLYGLATDDAHNHLEFKMNTSNPGRGWIMVKATQLTPAALISAMERGDFYATTGVTLSEIKTETRSLRVAVNPEVGVSYTIQFWGATQNADGLKQGGELLKEVKGTQATYKFRKQDLFVRAKIISSKLKENPYRAGDLETAWVQPVKVN